MRARDFLLEYDRQKTRDLLFDKMKARMDPELIDERHSEQFWTARANKVMNDWSTILMHDYDRAWDQLHYYLGHGRHKYMGHIKLVLEPFWTNGKIVDLVFEFAEEADPTRNNKFVPMIINWWLEWELAVEDFYKVRESFETYVRFRNRINLDLRSISWREFEAAMLEEGNLPSLAKLDKEEERAFYANGSADVIADNSTYKIVVPRTKEAAMFFGKNTRWCTSAANNNQFDYYNRFAPLYIVLFKKLNRRWQFSFWASQFMNELDRPLTKDEIAASPIANWFDTMIREQIPHHGNLVFEMISPTIDDLKLAIRHDDTILQTYHPNSKISMNPSDNVRAFFRKFSSREIDEVIRWDVRETLNRFGIPDALPAAGGSIGRQIASLINLLTHPTKEEADWLLKAS